MKQWETAETFRKTNPAMMKQAAANKRNRTSQNAKKAGYYRGGSRKMTTWMKVIEKFDSLVTSQMKENDSGEAISLTEQELWVEACDGPQNGRIFALGEQGTAMIRAKTFGCSPTQSQTSQTFQETIVQPFKEEIQELRETVRDLVNQQQVQQQQHLDFQSLILQQLLKLQGNSAPVSNSN